MSIRNPIRIQNKLNFGFSTASLIKNNLYEEYKKKIDHYIPIDEVLDIINSNKNKILDPDYKKQLYDLVKRLYDSGMTDPWEVSEKSGIPFPIIDDLFDEIELEVDIEENKV